MGSENETEEGWEIGSWWAILGGATVGVAAIAAAPFTGGGSVLAATVGLASSLAGTGTAAATAAGVVGGAVAGGALSQLAKDSAKDQAYRKAVTVSKAEYDQKLKKLMAQVEPLLTAKKQQDEYFNTIVAMTAIGMCAANCDGEIHNEERKSIELFISGIQATNLPDWVKNSIEDMYRTPPNLQTAFHIAQNANISFELIDQIIEVTIHSDGIIHQEERAFLTAWTKLKSESFESGSEDELENLIATVKPYLASLSGQEDYFNSIVGMAAITISAANCDGDILDRKRQPIERFISGIRDSKLPKRVQTTIDNMRKFPRNAETALQWALNAHIPTDLIEEIIRVTIHVNGVPHDKAQGFLAAWHDLKSAA